MVSLVHECLLWVTLQRCQSESMSCISVKCFDHERFVSFHLWRFGSMALFLYDTSDGEHAHEGAHWSMFTDTLFWEQQSFYLPARVQWLLPLHMSVLWCLCLFWFGWLVCLVSQLVGRLGWLVSSFIGCVFFCLKRVLLVLAGLCSFSLNVTWVCTP